MARLLKAESNIPVLTESAKCVGLMAQGLRGDFERPAKQLLPMALGRIIDKSVWKPSILVDRVEQLLWSLPYEFFFDELRQYLACKSIWAKKEAMALLLRTLDLPQVQETCPNAAQRFLLQISESLLPAIDDSDSGVRLETAKCLAILIHRTGSLPEDVVPVLMRIPTTRQGAFQSSFEEEWKKTKNAPQPCPISGLFVEQQERRSGSCTRGNGGRNHSPSQGNSRQPTPLPRSRPASPTRAAQPAASSSRSRTKSPSKARPPANSARARQADRGCVNAQVKRSASSESIRAKPLEDSVVVESSFVKEMKEEIKTLRSAVCRLERERGSVELGEVVSGTAPARSNLEPSEVQPTTSALHASLGPTEAPQDQQQHATVQESPLAAAEEATVQQQPPEQPLQCSQQQQQQQ
eukprot:CAMPEP_0172696846 /NCGR_PEP_ID=MMETSP1074-20121228/28337_1 /TAXON_ID=2916 /ORGANISM="Ceratium fusus, Strain PA161109" /LENGTH=408 /DNA_ID=CAMNT_0013517653 /DNA_START=45 /DNA_END=1268 /DNA_ORIENTATION=+